MVTKDQISTNIHLEYITNTIKLLQHKTHMTNQKESKSNQLTLKLIIK